MNTYRNHCLDLGNRFLKYRNGSSAPRMMLSALSEIIANSRPNVDPATSTEVQYLDGKPEYKGKRWLVGESARELPGYTNTVSLQNKVEEALRLTLATIQPSHAGEVIVLDCLYVTVPDPERDDHIAQESLVGTHHIVSNGVEVTMIINHVICCAEAAAGYNYAIQQGILHRGRVNGVLDLGGGTAIGALFNPKGQEIRDARAVFRKSGAFGLAARIAADPDMKAIARGAAAMDKLMDAIARGDYLYAATGQSFKHLFDAHHPIWLKFLVNEVVSRWDAYIDDIDKIVIIGGTAPLAEPLIRSPKNVWFKSCPNPQYANVLGLLGLGKDLVMVGA